MTLVFSDPLFEQHRTGYHPECAERLQRTILHLENMPWFSKLSKGQIVAASEELIKRTHAPDVVEKARKLSESGGGFLDSDTFVSSESFQVALHSAGTAIAAVERVVRGDDRNALCLLRPPGHHATSRQSMGFCVFNNIAIAAQYARDVKGIDKILIVDFDVHHGNGTQEIFYEDDAVHFLSIHRFPFYPGTGSGQETGSGPGLGATRNIPIAFGTSRQLYRDQFRRGLEQVVEKSRPELVLISAGFDAHKDDPVGSLGLEIEDYQLLTGWIMETADVFAKGRIVSCLEGGYNLETLPKLVGTHLETLAKIQQT